MQRQLQLIILGHIWALAPVALFWFLRPDWRGPIVAGASGGLAALALIAGAYMLLRTALTLRGVMAATPVWPYIDIALITAGLAILRSPLDAMSVLYVIPLASAVASLRLTQLVWIGGVAVVSYLGVILYAQTPWTIGLGYQVVITLLIASLYGWIIRIVSAFERAAERAQYQTALAREIHDGIQHILVTMGARLDLARRLVGEAPARAERILGEERETVRAASDELRYLVRRLRATPGANLTSALRTQVAALADRWPFNLEMDVADALPRLGPEAEHALLRVVQEALTNAAKHAQATSVDVVVAPTDGELRCEIRDDGRGFDPSEPRDGGLEGLKARVQELGGTITVESHPGSGTTVVATFPLPSAGR